eukprot:TRINITY_DN2720_c0_g1_i1.p1 TRINITY_DN2720_c0_g1~~TRINITY_DN2720_c0_g1_i1.p1  ORF type:complete len:753 (+),score=196.28 TRINITY_DN2720_c0_g1_i1:37-2295(+)
MSQQSQSLHIIDVEKQQLTDFFRGFIDDNENFKYLNLIQRMVNRETKVILVEVDDIITYFQRSSDIPPFVFDISTNTLKYIAFIEDVVEDISKDMNVTTVITDDLKDTLDYLFESVMNSTENSELAFKNFPKQLRRRYEVKIRPASGVVEQSIREVNAKNVGNLVKIRGIVLRMNDPAPFINVAAYRCMNCKQEFFRPITEEKFLPDDKCSNCGKDWLTLIPNGCKFVKHQVILLQELSQQVPPSHMPRTLNVYAQGDHVTEKCQAGDDVTIEGIFLPKPVSGYQALTLGLCAEMYLQAQNITLHKNRYEETVLNSEEQQQLNELIADPNRYTTLTKGIAPQIWGHEDIKRALLLLLISGVTKTMKDGVKIRGDINVLIMGDPGVAKSQFLKHVSAIAPRSIYTTGQGSSGVGLTAAVVIDPATRETTLEGGALVLADCGVCCIDEFDKMADADRTSIYEVMEQQTISIAKGGITATLNARTSILAAANPKYSRYDRSKTPTQNVELDAALLSRFDFIIVIVDDADPEMDRALARHVTRAHMTHHSMITSNDRATNLDSDSDSDSDAELELTGEKEISAKVLRAFISHAREYSPSVPVELTNSVADEYVSIRQAERLNHRNPNKGMVGHTSPRSLLTVLRLSQALARIDLAREVSQEHINEALRLISSAQASLAPSVSRQKKDPKLEVYNIVKSMVNQSEGDLYSTDTSVDLNELREACIVRGINAEKFDDALRHYDEVGIWEVTENSVVLI